MTTPKWAPIALMLCVMGGWTYLWVTDAPRLPLESANGSYYNVCCGTIRLQNGKLQSGRLSISYTIEYDKGGAYVLPKGLVSVASDRLDIEHGSYPLKLRLDRPSDPTRLDIADRSDAPSHSFKLVNRR